MSYIWSQAIVLLHTDEIYFKNLDVRKILKRKVESIAVDAERFSMIYLFRFIIWSAWFARSHAMPLVAEIFVLHGPWFGILFGPQWNLRKRKTRFRSDRPTSTHWKPLVAEV